MSDTLWTPWRMDYIRGEKPDGCVFCTALADGPEKHRENLILFEGEAAFVIMNRFPYAHAHTMVLPKRHVPWLEVLSSTEAKEVFDLVLLTQTIIKEVINPQGLNIGINLGEAAGAGIEDHLHVHIVPRWTGDTNFMPLLADTRVMPEHLDETFAHLYSAFHKAGR
ncbi:MAG: HIT domain-containing protein [Myxococcota bacterium]|nr:HIT domain-containing protein [Myxococcota bacterium]